MKRLTVTILTAAVAFAFLMYFLFSSSFAGAVFSIMSISFLLLIPFGMGALTIYLSDIEKVKKLSYRIFMPWLPIMAFLVLTMLFALEGWACWLMILPIFLATASAGGCTSGYFKLKKYNKSKAYVFILLLLPLFAAPIEHLIGAIPGRYEAYTYIDILADKQTIWDNVTRVKQINKNQDSGWLTKSLGFPRPIRAELNYNGVGAYRKAIFDKGLIFHEEVYRYEEGHRMDFTIKANPYEIPSTTMDKHVVIGGDYFDVLNGTYILQQTGVGKYRLHLYSHFKLTTTFNFYASWWAGWIMSDIQNNILQVIKQRAEH